MDKFNKPPPPHNVVVRWKARGAIIAISVLAIIVAAVAIGLAGFAISHNNNESGPRLLYISGPLPSTPFVTYIDQAAAPLAMTIPLGGFAAGNVYRIWSRTAQPHTLTLQGGATWDGVKTVATWSGAIGDGLVFEFLDSTKVGLHTVKGVVFS